MPVLSKLKRRFAITIIRFAYRDGMSVKFRLRVVQRFGSWWPVDEDFSAARAR